MSALDPEVAAVLSQHLRLVASDEAGRPQAEGGRVYAVLGPVPLPISLVTGVTAVVRWTVFSRLTPSALAGVDPAALGPQGRLELLQRLSGATEWAQSILAHDGFAAAQLPLVRIHSNCATGDVFGSQRCECGPQLRAALTQIHGAGGGAVVYMADHEGRGIGLFAKAAAYLLQDRGMDTYEANRRLGYDEDDRDFSDAAFILNHLRGEGRPIRLLSNNPDKRAALEAAGVEVVEMVPLVTGVNPNNVRYMTSKREAGHLLPEDLLSPLRPLSSTREAPGVLRPPPSPPSKG